MFKVSMRQDKNMSRGKFIFILKILYYLLYGNYFLMLTIHQFVLLFITQFRLSQAFEIFSFGTPICRFLLKFLIIIVLYPIPRQIGYPKAASSLIVQFYFSSGTVLIQF